MWWNRVMTKKELEALLDKYPDDTEVFIGYYNQEYRAWEYLYTDEITEYISKRDPEFKGIVIS